MQQECGIINREQVGSDGVPALFWFLTEGVVVAMVLLARECMRNDVISWCHTSQQRKQAIPNAHAGTTERYTCSPLNTCSSLQWHACFSPRFQCLTGWRGYRSEVVAVCADPDTAWFGRSWRAWLHYCTTAGSATGGHFLQPMKVAACTSCIIERNTTHVLAHFYIIRIIVSWK